MSGATKVSNGKSAISHLVTQTARIQTNSRDMKRVGEIKKSYNTKHFYQLENVSLFQFI